MSDAMMAVNFPTLGYGFAYDDYGFVRPYTSSEVLASFHGPWDPFGPNVAFFRPLTVAFHAARFELLQFDPLLHHALSLVLFGVAVGLVGATVFRIAGSFWPALLATAFTASHPHMPYAATAWITNQMHLLQLVIFAAGLRWWWVCRERPFAWWSPLVVLQVAAFLVKEDGIMFTPVIVAAHLLWTSLVGRRPAFPPWAFLASACAVGMAALWWRHAALGGLGGYGLPSWERAGANLWRGFSRTIALQPVDRPGKLVATVFVVAVSVAGATGAALDRTSRKPVFLVALGLAIVSLCDLPYALVTKREQWHLLSLGGAVLLTGAAWGVWRAVHAQWVRIAFAVATVACVVTTSWVSRQMASDFAPYNPITLDTDRIVAGWAMVAPEIREFLDAKQDAWRRERRTMRFPGDVPLLSYGVYGWETTPAGDRFRWMAGRVTLFVNARARRVEVPVLPLPIAGQPPAGRVSVVLDGSRIREDALDTGRWTTLSVDIPARPSWIPGRLVRIDLRFDRWVVPSQVIEGSGDSRTIAARCGPIAIDR